MKSNIHKYEQTLQLELLGKCVELIHRSETSEVWLQEICNMIASAFAETDSTSICIFFNAKRFYSNQFEKKNNIKRTDFDLPNDIEGAIEIYSSNNEITGSPIVHLFMNSVAAIISGALSKELLKQALRENTGRLKDQNVEKAEITNSRNPLIGKRQLLDQFFNRPIPDKYIYLDMMRYKIKEILIVTTLYDAFILEYEDGFFEQVIDEIDQYNLFSHPHITAASSADDAIEMVRNNRFDMVIIMVGTEPKPPIELSEKIKQLQPRLLVYLLLNQTSNIKYFEGLIPAIKSIDNLFVWNSDPRIIFSIVKLTEDILNVENDTKIGLVRVILLIEDSAQYYSKYLQILYSIVLEQIQKLLPEVEKNELDKISKIRSRPKILLARNYEDAVAIFNKYKDFILCVISDVEFDHNGKPDKTAGVKFIKYAQSHILSLPIILQSSDPDNLQLAEKLKIRFVNKNSDSLLNDLKMFLAFHLGFGDFVFRDKRGNPIAVARSLNEFESLLQTIPEESLYFQGIDNQFSLWLMARGEIHLAKILNPVKINDFENMEEFRKYFINTIKQYHEEKKKGKILNFEETLTFDEKSIVSLSSGSLGGKGRGLAFINTLIYNLNFPDLSRRINIRTPITAIIGTDEFDLFMEKNQLFRKVIDSNAAYEDIKQLFLNAELSSSLIKKLQTFVSQINRPIAVRSSSTSEDSAEQPFAGIFNTFVVPNNPGYEDKTLESVKNAIKMVYASVYSDDAKAYFKALNHKVEDERMAIILQELVGTQHENYYYPDISGTAQSYNYYPVAHMKPEEGYAVAAVGLGYYVVGGNKSYRFSPKYPAIDIYTPKDLLNSSQTSFYAVTLSKKDFDFKKEGELASLELLDINVAENHGTLNHLASVYNPDNDRIETGLATYGPRVLNFADILKFDYIPLAQTLDIMLNTIKEALGAPVEIEYAVDLNRTLNNLPSFYLLQIKHLVNSYVFADINIDNVDRARIILYSGSSLGNGEINTVNDIIFVDTEKFNKLKTVDMAKEIEHLNQLMVAQDRKYILIGPGRWGTRDYSLGIPVTWSQISNARVIVEISMTNYPLDASLGSHFFHNVTSMNIGYLSMQASSLTDFIRWNILNEQTVVNQTNYLKHIRFNQPLTVLMNGKQKKAVILYND